VTDDRSPIDAVLDVVLYAPVGLALTVGEEVPKLAAKGRTLLSTRWTTARVVGQFAVAQGRNEVRRRTGAPSRPRASAPPTPTPGTGAPFVPSTATPAPPVTPSSDVIAPSSSTNGAVREPAGPFEARTGSGPAVVTAVPRPPSTPPRSGLSDAATGHSTAAPSADALAIPGYDSLSASQVVQRLAGLAPDELEAVRAYEAATRGRRTILARVSQLQGT